jgi:hypothetical protein
VGVSGMIAISDLNVHSGPCVAALWFVSRSSTSIVCNHVDVSNVV